MKKLLPVIIFLTFILLSVRLIEAQVQQYKGDSINRYENHHSGNKINTIFYNYGLVGNVNETSCEWPVGTGDEYVGDVTPLVGIEYIHASGETLHSVITCSSPRQSPEYFMGTFSGFEPLPGFAGMPIPGEVGLVAMSQLNNTWPSFWPDKMYTDANDQGWVRDDYDPGWPDSWNGYFGKDVMNADQESYFQMDDHQDMERRNREIDIPNTATADPLDIVTVPVTFYPDATDTSRGGCGIRVSVRGLQWAHFLAEDCIFWLYEITNVGTQFYDKVSFGMVVGTLAGGRNDSEDDLAFFEPENDITYSWDGTPGPIPGWVWVNDEIQVGYAGYAFLESPGNPYDGIDNDGDSEDPGSPILDTPTLLEMTQSTELNIGQTFILIDYETYQRQSASMPGPFPGLDQTNIDAVYDWINDGCDSLVYINTVQPVFDQNCISCHSTPASPFYAMLDLTWYGGLVDTFRSSSPDTAYTHFDSSLVIPNFPTTSPLMLAIWGETDVRMPPQGYLNFDFRGAQRTVLANLTIQEDPYNLFDDNYNGLIDERLTGEVNGKRLDHLNLKYKDYFSGAGVNDPMIDEARDDGIDNDGDWDPLADDLGFDGQPGTGDLGEGDGVPSYGEPNFDKTDVDESDQIGLTSFDYFSPPGAVRMNDDEGIWGRMRPGVIDVTPDIPEDGDFIYGSGYFPLPPGKTERFSMALLFGEDLQDITDNKLTVQQIYDNNYNFAMPPDKPTVTAVSGDGQVTLYWDDIAEFSYDPSNEGNENDFEGYKIYRATDPGFLETFTITDGLGRTVFNEPIAQFDLTNGNSGFFPLSIYGASYYLGEDTGLTHVWTDTTAENGQQYYYAVCAYDNGNEALGFFPAENSKYVFVDEGGNVTTDINTVVVTPTAPAAGYTPPEMSAAEHIFGSSSGLIYIDLVDPTLVADNKIYQISFGNDTLNQATTYSIADISDTSSPEIIFSDEDLTITQDDDAILSMFNSYFDSLYNLYPGTYSTVQWFTTVQSPVFDGQRIYLIKPRFPTQPILESSGWSTFGNHDPDSMFTYTFGLINYPNAYFSGQAWSADYQVRFYDNVVDTTIYYNYYNLISFTDTPVYFQVWNMSGDYAPLMAVDEASATTDGKLQAGEALLIFETDGPDTIPTYAISITGNLQQGNIYLPEGGDTLVVNMYKAFSSDDLYNYSTSAAAIDQDQIDLSRIKVYPNPYLGANTQEPANPYSSGRGERRITFIHLPDQCTIRIYSIRGELVDTVTHFTAIDDGSENWDLRSKDGLDVAYGIYLYHVDSPYGERVGKFALVK